jgi:hypothetical protein
MTADVVPIRRPAPVPLAPADADVIQLPTATQPEPAPPAVRRGRRYPPRRGHGGHDPDCPYSSHGSPDQCPVCQGIRKGRSDQHDQDHDRTA